MLLIVSCSSYTITPLSFKEQVTSNPPLTKTQFELNNAAYSGDLLKELEVLKSNGDVVLLSTEEAVLLKVEKADGSKAKLYLNSVLVSNDTLRGMGPTYLVGGMIHEIPFSEITEIKVKP